MEKVDHDGGDDGDGCFSQVFTKDNRTFESEQISMEECIWSVSEGFQDLFPIQCDCIPVVAAVTG